jgi:peroxiredoxin Q/BCP
MSISIGDTIPDFKLTDQNGNEFDSASVKGKQNLVIYFYPKNFTPGCTKEACSFRDSYEDFKSLGATVIGVSSDSKKSHERFAKKYNLPFVLLSDENGKVKRKFGVKNNLLGLLPGRETYVVDKNGIVIYVFNSINAERHIKKALEALQKNS